jgi:hypothetical protein
VGRQLAGIEKPSFSRHSRNAEQSEIPPLSSENNSAAALAGGGFRARFRAGGRAAESLEDSREPFAVPGGDRATPAIADRRLTRPFDAMRRQAALPAPGMF